MTHDEVPAELVEKAKREIYDRLPAGGASVWLLADQMARHAIAAVLPEIQAQAQQAQIAAQEPAGATQGGSGDSRTTGGLDGAPATDWSKVEHTADQCQFEECPSCGCCAHGKEHVIGCSTTLDRPLGTDCPNPDCACKGGMG